MVFEFTESLLSQSYAQIERGGGRDAFISEVTAALMAAADLRRFAHGVMGVYASSESLAELPPTKRRQREAQIDSFAEVFFSGLVRNYGGIFLTVLRLGDIEVETLPAKVSGKSGKVTVEQLVFGIGTAKPIRIYYRLQRREADGRWELLNMAVDKLNFGKLFRSQFYSLAAQYDEDLDKVIEHWVALDTAPAAEAAGGSGAGQKAEPPRSGSGGR